MRLQYSRFFIFRPSIFHHGKERLQVLEKFNTFHLIEPLLLIPIAFGGLLANIPMPPGEAIAGAQGFLGIIFNFGINSGLFPLFIFMSVGAMTDFGPMIANPKTALLGGAAQFGIFATLVGAIALSYITIGIKKKL